MHATVWTEMFSCHSIKITISLERLKGCGMGPLLVFVSPCFRENVVVTCKIGFFCVVKIYFTSEKRNCFLFLEIKFQNGAHLKNGLFLAYFSHFFSHQGKVAKIPPARISLTYIHILLTLMTFLHYQM